MNQSVYIETSVISYYAALPSRDLIVAGHQQTTLDWWHNRLSHFKPYISEFVVQEASAGDKEAAKKRLNSIKGIPLLEVTAETRKLALLFIKEGSIPPKAAVDAFHIAVATIHEINFLVTWNCAHIANAEIRQQFLFIANQYEYNLPVICTPEELMGEHFYGKR